MRLPGDGVHGAPEWPVDMGYDPTRMQRFLRACAARKWQLYAGYERFLDNLAEWWFTPVGEENRYGAQTVRGDCVELGVMLAMAVIFSGVAVVLLGVVGLPWWTTPHEQWYRWLQP